ncbi:MAG: hypothetical protein Q8L68_02035 [Methylococcales bacterium]|nr:hypothetical protein [Methylococcales bacterium]
MGKDEALQLQVNQAIDTIGQAFPEDHAITTGNYKPDALVIILDISTEWDGDNAYSAGFYLEEFLAHLSEQLNEKKAFKKNLNSIIIILNKKDLTSAEKILKWKTAIELLLQNKLSYSFGAKTKDILVMPCTLLEGQDGGKSANLVITTLALAFS